MDPYIQDPFVQSTLTRVEAQAYLQRIKLSPTLLDTPLSLELLSQILLAQLEEIPKDTGPLHVPEEQWAGPPTPIQLGTSFSNMPLGVASLHRIVEETKGAFCFAVNASFAALLRAFGFTISELVARSFRSLNNDPLTHPDGWKWGTFTHQVLIAGWAGSDDRYVVDAAWGPWGLAKPIKLTTNPDGETVLGLNEFEAYRLLHEDLPLNANVARPIDNIPGYTLYKRIAPVGTSISLPVTDESPGYWSPQFHFYLISVTKPDFMLYHHYSATHVNASFTAFWLVTKLIPGGKGARLQMMYADKEGEGRRAKVYITGGPEAQGSLAGRDVQWVDMETGPMKEFLVKHFGSLKILDQMTNPSNMTAIYNILSQLPVPKAGQFTFSETVQVISTVRDNAKNTRKSLASSISLRESVERVNASGEDMGDIVASTYATKDSVSYPRRAILRETTSNKRFLEIWLGNTLEASRDITEDHGAVYTEEFFSSFAFSQTSHAFMYVAEHTVDDPTDAFAKYRFKPTLGETYDGKTSPAIFIFRWDPLDIELPSSLSRIAPSLPDNRAILLGQPVFSPTEANIIYATGYEYTSDGRLLGLKWCYNRPSGIWRLTVPESDSGEVVSCVCEKLTRPELSCRSPRIYHEIHTNEATLLWLSHASGGPHAGTFSLQAANIEGGTWNIRTVVDTVQEPATDGFPGLYPDSGNLPSSPFLVLDNEAFLVVSTTWNSQGMILLVSLHDGSVRNITQTKQTLYSWSVLATDGHTRLLCSRSALTVPYEIVLGEVDKTGYAAWKVLASPYTSTTVTATLSTISSSIIAIPGRGATQTIIVRSPDAPATNPCVQFIHGGPHAAWTTVFSPEIVDCVLRGYTVSLPNYRGSLGYGEKSVRSLVGNCGSLDVQDCIETARHLVKMGLSSEGPGKQFVSGGSHGGFLTAHLIGQYPEFFTAATLRNPVIFADALSSDIPDWYSNEWAIEYPMLSSALGLPGKEARPADLPRRNPEDLVRLFKTAPIAHVDNVKAHVLLHIGGSDVRVTPTQGIEYYHALRGKPREGRHVEMMVFPDEGHSLDGVRTSKVVWESTMQWLDQYRE
ncbi:Peptidase-S9 domain-containing protein [Mycena indigotica]|uniref:acylaminoacyl-peptidase n=1 Tax=Mycena indigotica TaxID=2126181 RepID=A0A8H6SD97_9AGAR|nr:Peptidase-S9 domain-containing protein [Mycena indigotica]KAF7297410.1 Peptidase-S9 domain-containing protein [Mycena indigotica]